MKIFLLIQALNQGGSERQLVILAQALHARGLDVIVGVFYPGGTLEPELIRAGVRLLNLEKRGRWDVVGFLWRTYRAARREKPDILYSFLPMANLVATLVGRLSPRPRIVWSLRAAVVDLASYDWLTRLTYRLERALSAAPALITVNSRAGRDHHARLGYPTDKMVIIHNGIDSRRFTPDVEAGRRLRLEWGVKPNETLIGLVARIDPMKDHPTFLRAVAVALKEMKDLRFVCVGDGPPDYKRRIRALATELNLNARVMWAGASDDMPPVYNALDIATSSSRGEGFPNVIGEAMACGVPCVVTDVGDSALIVGDTGLTVAPRDPAALADGWRRLLERPDEARTDMGLRARQRICERFSVEALSKNVDKTLRELMR